MARTRPIKLAHITTIPVSLEILLLDQIKYMQSAGIEVVGISSKGQEVESLRREGISHFSVQMTRRITPLRDLFAIWRLFVLFKRECFDIVHTHNPKPALVGRIAARLAGVPVVVHTVHGFHFHENMPRILNLVLMKVEKFGGMFGDLVFSQNHEDLEIALKQKIYPASKLRYLGNGINLRHFSRSDDHRIVLGRLRQELGLSEEQQVVGFVGRLAKGRKGVESLLQAMVLVKQTVPSAKLLLVGAPDEGKSDSISKSEINAMGLGEVCVFADWRSQAEMPAIYQLMKVLALPSSFEGLPRAIMEASAMGVPVVATDVKGNREAVLHKKTGLLVPYANPEMLADALCAVLTNSELAASLGESGRVFAELNFDQQKVFASLLRAYIEITEKKNEV